MSKEITDIVGIFYRTLNKKGSNKNLSLIYINIKNIYIYSHFFIRIIYFLNVTMVKGIMNLVCVGKYPIYINELSAYCAALVIIIICNITYI